MNVRTSKTHSDFEYFNARLDEIQMSGHDRLRAKASFARAEAVAGLMVDLAGALKRLLKTRVLRPIRRLTTNLG